MRAKKKMMLVGGLAIVIGAWSTYAVVEARQYYSAVRAAADAENIDYDELVMPAHWPLELFASDLNRVTHPEEAERIVGNASSSVGYFIAPVGVSDSALVVVFSFSLGWRTNTISVTIPKGASTSVDGSDFFPPGFPVERETGIAWFEGRSPP